MHIESHASVQPGSEADGCYCDSINDKDSVRAHPLLTASLAHRNRRKSMNAISYWKPVLVGIVALPIYLAGANAIAARHLGITAELIWSIVGFLAPTLYATVDYHYLKRTGGIFRVRNTLDDYRHFYVPAWKRMAVLFVTAAITLLVLKVMGMNV